MGLTGIHSAVLVHGLILTRGVDMKTILTILITLCMVIPCYAGGVMMMGGGVPVAGVSECTGKLGCQNL